MNNKKDEKFSFRELVLLYHKNGQGDIAKTYSNEQENEFYNLVSLKLSKKYPKFVNHEQAYDLLKDNGKIVTTYMIDKRGFYDSKRNIIGIRHFLNRLTTAIFHEIVHKLSYLAGNGEIEKLPEIYREAGTELITAETLKTKNTKACVLDNIWGIFPNTISSYFLEYIFVNQLNSVLGGDSLEESILKGNLAFEKRMKEYLGEAKYDAITKRLTGINKDFYCYSAFYNINSSRENKKLRTSINIAIDEIQDMILRAGFDKKIENAQTPEESNQILDCMVQFSNLRLRRSENKSFVDNEFKEYFNIAKEKFLSKFPNSSFEQDFTPDDWKNRYPEFKKVVQITQEEDDIVKRMGKENYRKFNGTILERIFGKKNESIDEFPISYANHTRNFDRELKVEKVAPITSEKKVTNNKSKSNKKTDKPHDVK